MNDAIANLLMAARSASATLSHAYHQGSLAGDLAEEAHSDYQRLDAAIAALTPPAATPRVLPSVAGDAGELPEPAAFRDILDAIEHCASASDEGVDYAISRPMIDALTTLGLLQKTGRGLWTITEEGKRLASYRRLATAEQPEGKDDPFFGPVDRRAVVFPPRPYASLPSTIPAAPAAPVGVDAYEKGWINAAKWAQRVDLISDIGSAAYERDKTAALQPDSGEG